MMYPITKSDILRYYHINTDYKFLRYCYQDITGYSKSVLGMFVLLDENKQVLSPKDYESAHTVWFIAKSPFREMEKNSRASNTPLDNFALDRWAIYKIFLFRYSFQDTIKNPKTNFYFVRK